MDRDDFNKIMRTLNDCFGGYNPSIYDSWYDSIGKYDYGTCASAIWKLVETMKTKPRIADIREAMGKETVNGGSSVTENHGCSICSGGWVMMEVEPGILAGVRCICEMGDRLNAKSARLTDEHIKARRWNVKGQLVYPNTEEMKREERLMKMNHDELISWCKRGMDRMKGVI